MTTEEKAKAYDEALKRAKAAYGTGAYDDITLEFIFPFPKLHESEDERILNGLIASIEDQINCGGEYYFGMSLKDILAWLEKQKDEEGYEAIPVESTLEYKLGFKAGKETEKQKEQKLNPDKEELIRHCIGLILTDATDERFKDYGLTLKDCLTWMGEQKEQKPAEWKATLNGEPIPTENHSVDISSQEWSGEDNICWDEAFACVTRAKKTAKNEEELQSAVTAEKWLKEIQFKYYVHPVKPEWSEEDEKIWNHIIDCAESKAWIPFNEISWLVAHKPQFHWKPSEDKEILKNILFQKKGITYDDYKCENDPYVGLYFDELIKCLEEYDKERSNR